MPGPLGRAEVVAEIAPLYHTPSLEPKPVAELRKGAVLWIDFEIKNGKESWCDVKQAPAARPLGYVRCTDVRRTGDRK